MHFLLVKLLITGATGFLGRYLLRSLVRSDHVLYVVGRGQASTKLQEYRHRIKRFIRIEGLERWREAIAEIAPDVVIHLACAYSHCGGKILPVIESNLILGACIVDAMSSIGGVMLNASTVLSPSLNSYALSKSQFSQWGKMVSERSRGQFQFLDLKVHTMYGYEPVATRFTSDVIHSCLKNQTSIDLTQGEQMRDFVHAEDVVSAIEFALLRKRELPYYYELEVGTGRSYSVRSFCEVVRELTCSRTSFNFGSIEYREHEQMVCVADIEKLLSLGWRPRFDLAEGLRHSIADFSL